MPGALTRWLSARRPARRGRAVSDRRRVGGRRARDQDGAGPVPARDTTRRSCRPACSTGRRGSTRCRRSPALTALWMLAAAGLTLGVRARTCAGVLVARCRSGLHLVDQNLWGHHVYFMTLVLLLLTMADSDASLSTRWIADGRPERDVEAGRCWLVQVQLSLAYLFTAVAKLNPVSQRRGPADRHRRCPRHGSGSRRWLSCWRCAPSSSSAFGLWMPVGASLGPCRGVRHCTAWCHPADGAVRRARRLHAAGVECLRPVPRRRAAVAARRVGRHVRVLPRVGAWLRRLDWLARSPLRRAPAAPRRSPRLACRPRRPAKESRCASGRGPSAASPPSWRILELLPVGFLWARAPGAAAIVSWLGAAAYRACPRGSGICPCMPQR